MYELKVVTHFGAAHQLKMMASKCENLHGHNWKIEVRVAGEELNKAGILVDFGEIKTHLKAVIKTLDHRFLNELDFFPDGHPSSENIARYIAHTLDEALTDPGVRVTRVSAWESHNACATYFMPRAPQK